MRRQERDFAKEDRDGEIQYLHDVMVFVIGKTGNANALAHALQAKQVALALMRNEAMDLTRRKERSL